MVPLRQVSHIVVHCSATPAGRYTTVDDIRNWHLQRGFADIGYHFVVLLDRPQDADRPAVDLIRPGRSMRYQGAHCVTNAANSYSIGVCYVGGCAKNNIWQAEDTRTPKQREALRLLLQALVNRYPDAKICGHRDFLKPGKNWKDCPSFDAIPEYEDILPFNRSDYILPE